MSTMASNSDSMRGLTSSSNPNEATPFPKKPAGSKDIGWEYGRLMKRDSYSEVQCKKCSKHFSKGANKIKQHIAWRSNNVKGYEKASPEDMAICRRVLDAPHKKERAEEEYKTGQEVRISEERV